MPLINDAPLPVVPPVNPPVTIGALQVYVVPAGTIPFVPFTGLTVKPTPLQVVVVIAVITAVGLIVTTTVKVALAPQFTVVGVTIYVAECAVFVGFVSVPLINDAPLPVVPPVRPPVTIGALQL